MVVKDPVVKMLINWTLKQIKLQINKEQGKKHFETSV